MFDLRQANRIGIYFGLPLVRNGGVGVKRKCQNPSYCPAWRQTGTIALTLDETEQLLLHHGIMYRRGRQEDEHSGEYLDFYSNARSKRTGEKIGKILARAGEAKVFEEVAQP